MPVIFFNSHFKEVWHEIHRILWNATKSIEYYGIHCILHDFVFIDINLDVCREYRRPPVGSAGAPQGVLGGHLALFDEILEK